MAEFVSCIAHGIHALSSSGDGDSTPLMDSIYQLFRQSSSSLEVIVERILSPSTPARVGCCHTPHVFRAPAWLYPTPLQHVPAWLHLMDPLPSENLTTLNSTIPGVLDDDDDDDDESDTLHDPHTCLLCRFLSTHCSSMLDCIQSIFLHRCGSTLQLYHHLCGVYTIYCQLEQCVLTGDIPLSLRSCPVAERHIFTKEAHPNEGCVNTHISLFLWKLLPMLCVQLYSCLPWILFPNAPQQHVMSSTSPQQAPLSAQMTPDCKLVDPFLPFIPYLLHCIASKLLTIASIAIQSRMLQHPVRLAVIYTIQPCVEILFQPPSTWFAFLELCPWISINTRHGPCSPDSLHSSYSSMISLLHQGQQDVQPDVFSDAMTQLQQAWCMAYDAALLTLSTPHGRSPSTHCSMPMDRDSTSLHPLYNLSTDFHAHIDALEGNQPRHGDLDVNLLLLSLQHTCVDTLLDCFRMLSSYDEDIEGYNPPITHCMFPPRLLRLLLSSAFPPSQQSLKDHILDHTLWAKLVSFLTEFYAADIDLSSCHTASLSSSTQSCYFHAMLRYVRWLYGSTQDSPLGSSSQALQIFSSYGLLLRRAMLIYGLQSGLPALLPEANPDAIIWDLSTTVQYVFHTYKMALSSDGIRDNIVSAVYAHGMAVERHEDQPNMPTRPTSRTAPIDPQCCAIESNLSSTQWICCCLTATDHHIITTLFHITCTSLLPILTSVPHRAIDLIVSTFGCLSYIDSASFASDIDLSLQLFKRREKLTLGTSLPHHHKPGAGDHQALILYTHRDMQSIAQVIRNLMEDIDRWSGGAVHGDVDAILPPLITSLCAPLLLLSHCARQATTVARHMTMLVQQVIPQLLQRIDLHHSQPQCQLAPNIVLDLLTSFLENPIISSTIQHRCHSEPCQIENCENGECQGASLVRFLVGLLHTHASSIV